MNLVRGAVAGATAAVVWASAEAMVGRAFGTPYSDVRLLGRMLPVGAAWRPAGIALHVANGALFGAAFERFGGHGWVQGVIAAEMENAALWPGMALIDRFHPDRRSGAWPPLAWNSRIFAYEATVHAIYGFVLGALMPSPEGPVER